jgi:hypothetical protein
MAGPVVLDCERVGTQFWVFDLLMLAGEDLRLMAPLHRRQLLESSWERLWQGLRVRGVPLLSLKPVFLQSKIEDLRREMARMPCDGLILQEAWDPLLPVLKFKEEVTIDVQVDSELRGFVRDASGSVVVWTEGIGVPEELSRKNLTGAIVECGWDQGHWKIERLRPDRTGPNSLAICEEAKVIAERGWNTWGWLTQVLSNVVPVEALRAAWVDACAWELLRRASALLPFPVKVAFESNVESRAVALAQSSGLFELVPEASADLLVYLKPVTDLSLLNEVVLCKRAVGFLTPGLPISCPSKRQITVQLPLPPVTFDDLPILRATLLI